MAISAVFINTPFTCHFWPYQKTLRNTLPVTVVICHRYDVTSPVERRPVDVHKTLYSRLKQETIFSWLDGKRKVSGRWPENVGQQELLTSTQKPNLHIVQTSSPTEMLLFLFQFVVINNSFLKRGFYIFQLVGSMRYCRLMPQFTWGPRHSGAMDGVCW